MMDGRIQFRARQGRQRGERGVGRDGEGKRREGGDYRSAGKG